MLTRSRVLFTAVVTASERRNAARAVRSLGSATAISTRRSGFGLPADLNRVNR